MYAMGPLGCPQHSVNRMLCFAHGEPDAVPVPLPVPVPVPAVPVCACACACVPRNQDFGEPVDNACYETAPNSGVFTREWTKATVTMDCNTWTPTITMNN
jgi:hypothetical protein